MRDWGKAKLSSLIGLKDGTSTERAHISKALPTGIARGLTDGLIRRDPSGFERATGYLAWVGCSNYWLFSRYALGAI